MSMVDKFHLVLSGLFLVIYSRTVIEHPRSIKGLCRTPFFRGAGGGGDGDDDDGKDDAKSPLLPPGCDYERGEVAAG